MIYNDWTATNTGIFYQLNRAKPLPFADNDTVTIERLDQQFLLENSQKEMFSNDTAVIVSSILAAYYHQWEDLATFYKSIEPGITSEIISTSNNNLQNQNKIALNDSNDMFTTGGNNTDSTGQTSTKTKDYKGYQDFVLGNKFYDIIKMQIRNYLFISIY